MSQPHLPFLVALLGLLIAYFSTTMVNVTTSTLPTAMTPDTSSAPTATPTTIIIGAGLAGLTASSTLLSLGVRVILLEAGPKPGGNSVKASSGINGASTPYQTSFSNKTSEGERSDVELFYEDMKRSAGEAMHEFAAEREVLMHKVTRESGEAITWLAGKDIDLSTVTRLGGHTAARTHRGGTTPPGWAIVSALLREVQGKQGFELRTRCEVLSLLTEKKADGKAKKVVGVTYRSPTGEKLELRGPVILTAGGFAGDEQELKRQRPDLEGYPSTNEHRTGAVDLLREVDALMVDMHRIQVHPTGFISPTDPLARVKFLAAEMLRGEGGILLRGGRRFVNEVERRDVVTGGITAEKPIDGLLRQWDVQILLDEGTYQAAKSHVDFYLSKTLMKKVTLGDLGPEIHHTITTYAHTVAHPDAHPDPLGRTHFGKWSLTDPTPEEVVYMGNVTPVVHFTMGGALINERAEVLGRNGEWIQGLWGAGEVTGGVHGENRLGGSSLLECVVFGRVAGGRVGEWVGGWKVDRGYLGGGLLGKVVGEGGLGGRLLSLVERDGW